MGEKSYVELGNQISEMVRLRACPNRIENRKRTSKSIRFRECFRRCVESKRKKRNAAEKRGRAATYGPFITMNTCQQSSFRQHRSTGAAGIHDNISTPGGRWAFYGDGGASDVDAPGSNFKLYWERTCSLVLERMMLKSSLILFALARTPGNKGPRTLGLLSWFACWLFTGDLCAVVPCWQWVVCCVRQP